MSNIVEFPKGEAKKAVILARVSSKEQEEGHSIEAQKHRLQVYCQRRGLEVLKVFEITESSTRGDRARFMEMIKFCKAQRQTIAIVADKVDRVQRSFKEHPLLESLIQEGKIELHFNTENYIIHKGSVSQERLMWSFSVILAQSYVDSLRDNIKRSFDHKIRTGEYVSHAPLGYLNVRHSGGRADIIVDHLRADTIRKIFAEYASGLYTLAHMTAAAKEWGLRTRSDKPISRSQMHKILTNPFYYGLMLIKGQTYPHKYPPLIDRAVFEQCQAVLKGWNKKPFKWGEKEFVFRGLLTCAANGRTVSSFVKKKTYLNGETAEWTYLRSWDKSGKLMYVREDKVLAQAEKAFRALVMPPEAMEEITAYLRSTGRSERDFARRKGEELQREHGRLQTRLDGMMDLLMDKAITREEFDRRRAELRQRQIEIESEQAAHRKGDDGFKDAMLFFLDLCNNAGDLFAGSNIEDKRALLGCVLSTLALDGETLCYSYKFPFSDWVEQTKEGKWWRR